MTLKEKKKAKLIKNLWGSVQCLSSDLRGIQELNKNGDQFDYVTDPKLSDVVDRLQILSTSINKIVYQKTRS